MVRPTRVELVKATLSMSIWLEIAAPAVLPKPKMTLITPRGKPASTMSLAAYRPERGVCSVVLITIVVLPVAMALGISIDGLTVDLVGPVAVVAQAARSVSYIHRDHGHSLAVIQDLDGG